MRGLGRDVGREPRRGHVRGPGVGLGRDPRRIRFPFVIERSEVNGGGDQWLGRAYKINDIV